MKADLIDEGCAVSVAGCQPYALLLSFSMIISFLYRENINDNFRSYKSMVDGMSD